MSTRTLEPAERYWPDLTLRALVRYPGRPRPTVVVIGTRPATEPTAPPVPGQMMLWPDPDR